MCGLKAKEEQTKIFPSGIHSLTEDRRLWKTNKKDGKTHRFFVKHFDPAFDGGIKCYINQLYYYYCFLMALIRCFVIDLQVRCHRHESVQECPERMRGPRTPQHPGLHLPAATAWEQQRAVQLHVATTSSRLQYHHHHPPRRVGSLMTDSVHHSRWQGQWPLLTLTQEHLEYETTFHVASSISKELARWRDSGTTRSDGWTTTTIVTGHFCQSHLEISRLWADRFSVLRLPKSKTNKLRALCVFSVVGLKNEY